MLPKNKSTFHGHIRSLVALNGGEGETFAAGVIRATLSQLLDADYPRLVDMGLRPRPSALSRRPELKAFAAWLRTAPFLEGAFWLSTAYAHLVTPDQRDEQALFFTPPTLSDRLIGALRHHGVKIAEARFADPSCGGAAFLAPVAIQIARELESMGWNSGRIVSHIERHVVGFEANPVLCELSQIFLNMALHEHVANSKRLLTPRVVHGNALVTAAADANSFDVVISNPPYRKLDAAEYLKLDEASRRLSHGQPNLYALFIGLALRLTRNDGHVGLLTPAGFFGGRSFSPLRRLIRATADVRQVDFIEPRIGAFVDVEQETALTVLHKTAKQSAPVSVNVTTNGREFLHLGSHQLPTELSAPWELPRGNEEVASLVVFELSRWRLADYGYEPKTGYLVPHRMPNQRLRSKGQRLWVCPLIWATQIGADGVHRFLPGRREHANLFVTVSPDDVRGVLTTPSVAVQRTSSKDQAQRVRCAPITAAFIAQHGGYMGENHVTFLVPINGKEPAVSVEALAALLNSRAVNRVFRCLSGTATVSAFELNSLPLPDPNAIGSAFAAGASMDETAEAAYALLAASSTASRKVA